MTLLFALTRLTTGSTRMSRVLDEPGQKSRRIEICKKISIQSESVVSQVSWWIPIHFNSSRNSIQRHFSFVAYMNLLIRKCSKLTCNVEEKFLGKELWFCLYQPLHPPIYPMLSNQFWKLPCDPCLSLSCHLSEYNPICRTNKRVKLMLNYC